MRHRKAGSKFNRNSSHRKAMFRNMVTSLMKHDRITTTDARAKALRGLADHLITLAKRGDLHARRQAMSIVREKDVVHKLFETANERFGGVSGGYTRVLKVGYRPGDATMMSIIELVTPDTRTKKKPAKKKKAAQAPSAPAVTPAAEETAAEIAAMETADTDAAEPVEETPTAETDGVDESTDAEKDVAADSETEKKD